MITGVSFIMLYLIIDFFEKIRMFLSNHATVIQMATYFLFSIPMIVSLILPRSSASCYIDDLQRYLSKYSEITAMKANGISLYRMFFASPDFCGNYRCPPCFISMNSLRRRPCKKPRILILLSRCRSKKAMGFFKQNEIWYHSDKAIYNFKMFDPCLQCFKGRYHQLSR